jgi:hypothetical protein
LPVAVDCGGSPVELWAYCLEGVPSFKQQWTRMDDNSLDIESKQDKISFVPVPFVKHEKHDCGQFQGDTQISPGSKEHISKSQNQNKSSICIPDIELVLGSQINDKAEKAPQLL